MALTLKGLSSIHSFLYLSGPLNFKPNSPLGAKEEVACVREGVSVSKQGVHIADLIICLMLRRTRLELLFPHSMHSLRFSIFAASKISVLPGSPTGT